MNETLTQAVLYLGRGGIIESSNITCSLFTIYCSFFLLFSFLFLKPHRLLRGRRLDSLDDLVLELLGLGGTGPAVDYLAVTADQELLKVPLDPLKTKQTRLLLLQPLIQRVRIVAVDVDLGHDGERRLLLQRAKVLNLLVAAGLLAAELVAGEADDGEVVGVLLLEGLVDGLEVLVLVGEAALGRRVDDQDDLALVVGQRDFGVGGCKKQGHSLAGKVPCSTGCKQIDRNLAQ